MCFKNLPVEFDEAGNAYLKEGVSDPYAFEHKELSRSKIEELLKRNGHIKSVDFDPVTRVAGALAFHSVVDLKERKVLETNSMATLFRGYEVILKGRDPLDAIFISSRACGVCGGVHSVAAALAIEMAFGIKPPPLGVIIRNLGLAMEFLYDHPLHLYLLAGPDYSELIVKQVEPSLWDKAQKWECPGAEIHGYKTMSELMTDLNPLTGKLYLEGLHMTRVAREAYVVIMSKYPHPETIVPGGISHTVTITSFNEYYTRLAKLFDYSKKMVSIWDDITEFYYEANPEYKKVGSRPANLADPGIWDDPEAYDATYENCAEWGDRRWATPGIIVDGELVTTNLQNINVGMEEFIDHSYYEEWTGQPYKTDPLGAPLSPYHPWNKETKPQPSGQNWRERYSWATSPRWDRQVVECGCYARTWNTALAQKLPHTEFITPTGHSLIMHVPKAALPAMDLEWKIPEHLNAFERNRCRAYCQAYNCMVAYDNWLKGLKLMRAGDSRVSTKFEVPKNERIGVGFWGAGRGWLTHHTTIDKGAIVNYQIVTPSTHNASPRDPWGNMGPYEESVYNTPILEEFSKPEDYKGIDILRTIRSFDPCMPCTTHIYAGEKVITREVNTCACGIEDE